MAPKLRFYHHERWWHAAMLLLSVPGAAGAGVAEPQHLTAVRFWSLDGVTRIAVEVDGEFQVNWDRLENPKRLFFDFSATKRTRGSNSINVIPVSDGLLRRIRVAERQHNVTRMVLDLEMQVEATTWHLENPNRLIIDLRTPGTTIKPDRTPPPTETSRGPRPPIAVPSAAPVRAKEPIFDPPELQLGAPPLEPGFPIAMLAQPASSEGTPAGGVISAPSPAPVESALPARLNSSRDRSMIRVLGLKVMRIVLDPGHGGPDTGSVGPEGLREKDLVLDIVQRLGRMIVERMGSEVIYTRTDNTFVPLERRTELANLAKADLFLSIHANSSPARSAEGVETYYLNFIPTTTAADLTAQENAGSKMTIGQVKEILQKIALKDKVERSREFASRVQSALSAMSAGTGARSKDRGVKPALFVVLIGASMPSALAEIGFVSNAHDERIMGEEYRQCTAEALYKGIASYARSLRSFPYCAVGNRGQ
jgi:N-acetylmuramoyl-L-alanine amidase